MYDVNELFNELFQTMKGGVNTAERIYDIIMKIESILEDFVEQFNNDLSVKKKMSP